MPNIQALTPDAFADKRWHPQKNYNFAAREAICPLVVQELPRAMLNLPIAFVEDDGAFFPVAVQGLEPGKNLLVSPEGNWLLGYIPATYRSYPFLIANNEEGEAILCIDLDSGCVTDSPDAQLFFGEDNEPSEVVARILSFSARLAENRVPTMKACEALKKFEVIKPWPLRVQIGETETDVDGLHMIDEDKLNGLPAEALKELNDTGAIALAYCQLLSMQHITGLIGLANSIDNAAKASPSTKELNFEAFSEGDTLNFDNI